MFISRLNFSLSEDEDENTLVLDLAVYRWDRWLCTSLYTCQSIKVLTRHPPRHLDTSLIDVDIQPTYARISVKGKVRPYFLFPQTITTVSQSSSTVATCCGLQVAFHLSR